VGPMSHKFSRVPKQVSIFFILTGQSRYKNEFYTLNDEADIVMVIKIGRLRWLGHLFTLQEMDASRKLTLLKLEGTRCVGKSKLKWLESVEDNLKKMGVRNW
jgi:hypothetical protein